MNLCPGQNGSMDFRRASLGHSNQRDKEDKSKNKVRCDCFDCIELMDPERFRL